MMSLHRVISFDPDSCEAEIEFTNKDSKFISYAWKFVQGNSKYHLVAFSSSDIEISKEKDGVQKIDEGYFAHKFFGKLKYRESEYGMIETCGELIEVKNIPNDIKIGNFVSFKCLRVDYLCE